MKYAICVPYGKTDKYRERNYNVVTGYLADVFTGKDATLVAAQDTNYPDLFNRGRALNRCIERVSDADIYVFADIDFIVDPYYIQKGLQLVEASISGSNPETFGLVAFPSYVIPYSTISFLKKSYTEKMLQSSQVDWNPGPNATDLQWDRHSTGGFNIVSRENLEIIGGFDNRFITWGYEDGAFDTVAATLIGEPVWLEHNCLHMWHPESFRNGKFAKQQEECLRLAQRYDKARGNLKEVLVLREEALIAKRVSPIIIPKTGLFGAQ